MNTAVFAGSFDPITKGHEDIINRAAPLFDILIVAIGINSEKRSLFSMEDRLSFLEQTFQCQSNIRIASYNGLLADFCAEQNARNIIRGFRSVVDLEYEKQLAHMNADLNPNIDTLFFLTAPEYAHISSSAVRDIIRYHKDISPFVPNAAKEIIKSKITTLSF